MSDMKLDEAGIAAAIAAALKCEEGELKTRQYVDDFTRAEKRSLAIIRAYLATAKADAGQRAGAETIMDAAWSKFGGSHQPAEYWEAFNEGVRFALASAPKPAEPAPAVAQPQAGDEVEAVWKHALDRLERAAMAYERLGKLTRDDDKTRQIRKSTIAELADARRAILCGIAAARPIIVAEALERAAKALEAMPLIRQSASGRFGMTSRDECVERIRSLKGEG